MTGTASSTAIGLCGIEVGMRQRGGEDGEGWGWRTAAELAAGGAQESTSARVVRDSVGDKAFVLFLVLPVVRKVAQGGSWVSSNQERLS